jgi:hypothetical protein
MARKIIDPKNAPIYWDTINEAFQRINDNFVELYAGGGGGGGGPVDLSGVSSSIIPGSSGAYDLGSSSKRWRDLYLIGNTIHLGNAQISSTGAIVNLPAGSTIGGALIKDPDVSAFKNIIVGGQATVVADNTTASLTLAGSGIAITTNALTDTVTFTNSGVTSAVAGAGMSVNTSTGAVTFTNTGVTSAVAGAGISLNNNTGTVTISNTGVTSIALGDQGGLNITRVGTAVTISNSAPNIVQSIWRFISAPSGNTLDPRNSGDTLSLVNGDGVSIVASNPNILTITNTGVTTIGGGTGISVSRGTGSVTLTNTGVTGLTGGTGLGVSASTGSITLSNTGVTSYNGSTGAITNYTFGTVAVTGQNPVVADAGADTLTLVNGTGVTMTTDATGDSVTIGVNGTLPSISAVELYSATPAQNYFNVEVGGDRVFRAGTRISGSQYANAEFAAYRVSPANGDNGPRLVFRASTAFSSNQGIAYLETQVTNVGSGTESSNINLKVMSAGSTVTPLQIVGSTNSVIAGAVKFTGSTITNIDSTGITVVPITTFQSDVIIENELVVRNSVRAKSFITDSVGVPEVSSVTNLNLTAGNAVVVTQSPFRLASLTTTARNLLTAQNGDLIYNTTANKIQGYQNGAWINIDTGAAA